MIRLAILAVGRGEMSLHSAAVYVRVHSVLSVVPHGQLPFSIDFVHYRQVKECVMDGDNLSYRKGDFIEIAVFRLHLFSAE